MTLYGIGLGPGQPDLVTVRGKRALESADVVYSPGRLSRSVATKHVPEERIGDLDFPMTRDEEKLRAAWKEAAAEIAPTARDGDAAFVTLGDPNATRPVAISGGRSRRFTPKSTSKWCPASALCRRSRPRSASKSPPGRAGAARGRPRRAPTGPDRMVLFKVTDAPATHESWPRPATTWCTAAGCSWSRARRS